MLISKEKFINYLNKYREAYEEQKRFYDALRPFFDSPECTYKDGLMEAYEELLVDVSECEDEDGIFTWWLFESSSGSKTIEVAEHGKKSRKFDVTTSEGMYDYLVCMYGGNK